MSICAQSFHVDLTMTTSHHSSCKLDIFEHIRSDMHPCLGFNIPCLYLYLVYYDATTFCEEAQMSVLAAPDAATYSASTIDVVVHF